MHVRGFAYIILCLRFVCGCMYKCMRVRVCTWCRSRSSTMQQNQSISLTIGISRASSLRRHTDDTRAHTTWYCPPTAAYTTTLDRYAIYNTNTCTDTHMHTRNHNTRARARICADATSNSNTARAHTPAITSESGTQILAHAHTQPHTQAHMT